MFKKLSQPRNSDAGIVSPLLETLNTTLQESTLNSNNEQVLHAILMEYNALRTEIQNRNSTQNTYLQIHITAITFIVGGALTLSFGHWLLFLIPVESALFGLWWLDNSFAILEIASYIKQSVEHRVSDLLKYEKVINWENESREKIIESKLRRLNIFNSVVFITFAGPAILSILYSLILLILSLFSRHNSLPKDISQLVNPIYPGASVWLAVFSLIIDLIFFSIYLLMFFYRVSIDATLKPEKLKAP